MDNNSKYKLPIISYEEFLNIKGFQEDFDNLCEEYNVTDENQKNEFQYYIYRGYCLGFNYANKCFSNIIEDFVKDINSQYFIKLKEDINFKEIK